MRSTSYVLAGLAGLAVVASAQADPVKLKLVPSGGMQKVGFYSPQRLQVSAERPQGIKKLPEGLSAPRFATLKFGAKESPSGIFVVLDEPEGKNATLLVDANTNGDLTDDAPAKWTSRKVQSGGKELTQYQGSFTVRLGAGGNVSLQAYRFDPNDANRAALKDVILYYTDYVYEGTLPVGGKELRAVLLDQYASGDFRGTPGERGSGIMLLIDVNSNGVFDARGERYDAAKPFNIGGTTYELKGLSADGSAFEVAKSAQQVAEIVPPPDLSVGKKALTFEAKTTDDKPVSFPSSYKGKVVLLDFWATWCGPCIGELPHLLAAYEKYHPKGLEVLGISLDREGAAEKLAAFTKERKMPWAQVYDGKFWEARVAQMYGVNSIPRAYLVDGTTGEILAAGNDLRGPQLDKTLEKIMANRVAAVR